MTSESDNQLFRKSSAHQKWDLLIPAIVDVESQFNASNPNAKVDCDFHVDDDDNITITCRSRHAFSTASSKPMKLCDIKASFRTVVGGLLQKRRVILLQRRPSSD